MRKKRGKKKEVKSQNKKKPTFIPTARERGGADPPCPHLRRDIQVQCFSLSHHSHRLVCAENALAASFFCVCVRACVFSSLSFSSFQFVCVKRVEFFFEKQIEDSPGNNRSTNNARNKIMNKGKKRTLMCGGWYICAKKDKKKKRNKQIAPTEDNCIISVRKQAQFRRRREINFKSSETEGAKTEKKNTHSSSKRRKERSN